MKSVFALALSALLLAGCVTGYSTDDERAAVRKQILGVVSVAWKSGGKALAQAELEKYIKEHDLDDAQAEFVRATAAGIVEAIEQQATEASK